MAEKSDKERIDAYMVELGQLEQERNIWEDLWEEAVHYTSPKRDMWADDSGDADGRGSEDVKKGQDLYDTHAVEAAKIEANGMVGWNSGPSVKWIKLKLMAEDMNELPFVKDWLEICERRLYQMLHRSNFYDQLFEFYLDLVTVGTATMLIEEDPDSMMINFSTRHPKETYICEGLNGRVNAAYRQVWYTGQQALDRYGEDLPDKFLEDLQDPDDKKRLKHLTKKYKFVHVIEKRHGRNTESALAQDKPIASVEFMPEEQEIVRESGYDEMPLIVTRWSKNSNEKYGRSPAMDGLSTIKRMNQEKLATLKAGHRAVEPPLNIPMEMQRNLDLSPNGANIYKTPERRIYATDLGRGYPFGKDMLEMLRDEVDNIFMVPLFRMLDRLDRQVTATEVTERQGERVAGLAGPLTRQNSEGLGPMIMRIFNIMSRAGLMPAPPPVLAKRGVPLDVEFTGLLAQAQRRYHQSQSLNAGLAQIHGIVEMAQDPKLLFNLDLDDLIRKIAETEGFPESSIREMPEVKKMIESYNKQIQEAKQQEQLATGADAMNKLSKAPEAGSPAEAVTEQMAGALG